MIKSEIRSVFRNLLPRWDKTNKWHDRVIDAAIEKVLAEMYTEAYRENPLILQRYCKQYGYTAPLSVLNEATTGMYYTTLPASYIPMPDKASGVRRISTAVQGGMTFFPIDQREHDLILSGSNSDIVSTRIGYCVTPTRVEFYNMSTAVINAGIRMDLLIPFSTYLDTDTVLIPEETDRQGRSFIDRVLAILGVVQKVDNLDDNSDPINKGQ